jgi:AraC-like DNA-binding protein
MVSIQVPEVLTNHQQLTSSDIAIVYYNEHTPVGRNLISFSKCAISFILSGQKELYRGAECTLVSEHEAVLIPDGHAIIAERKLNAQKYSSLVTFFPAELAQKFIVRYAKQNDYQHQSSPAEKDAFLKFHQTPYITEYLNGLIHLIDKQLLVPPALLLHKLEELFLILAESFPAQFFEIFRPSAADGDHQLRQIVENNILKNLSLNELALLANRSLATFKRDFEKEYGISPGKYIRERKLDIARHELTEGGALNDLYLQLGYENASNFTSAFKKRFGQTPKAYQSQAFILS